ncbi:MAG: DNA helicase PcrA [Clostridia bacterium]|nr:MAG: DNA helicase PcrA [Clostridia bacterium]
MAKVLELLNAQQLAAVRHPEGPLLVLAGAGSGKTRVLTSRIVYLVNSRGADPENILAITFTNKAAGEMRERLEVLLGRRLTGLWVGTFHAVCNRILRREIEVLGYKRNYSIYDPDDQLALLKTCLKDLNLDEHRFPARQVAAGISRAKNALLTPPELEQRARGLYETRAAQAYQMYQQRLQEQNAVDFDDLLTLAVTLFRGFPEVLARYQVQFRHILVDEYQDTNHAQYVLINLLARQHRNLFVVGDDDQSIYRWRGADLQNILDFQEDYPEAQVIKLEQNYRSTRFILEAANEVIGYNVGRMEKRLWTAVEGGHPVFCFTGADEAAEANFVITEIRRLQAEEGRLLSDFVLLYRTHAQSRVFEDAFLAGGIPYQVVGSLKFYERKEIKDLLAYLRLLVNPEDRVSLVRIINVPRRGIGAVTWTRLEEYAAGAGLTMDQAMRQAEKIPELVPGGAKAVAIFAQLMDSLRARVDKLSVTALVQEVLDQSGYLNWLKEEKTEEARSRVENLQEFLSVTRAWDAGTGGQGSLEDFLAQVSLTTEIDNYRGGEAVTLMTLHTAKGLEFPVVFLTGMEEGVFPHARSLEDMAELEEERRLCYVGMTRARERLYLTRAASRTLYGRAQTNPPSRFLNEIPEVLLERVGADFFRGGAALAGAYAPGDRVEHARWGEGVVVGVDGSGPEAVVVVEFPQYGMKQLLLSMAPLRKVER